MIIALYLPDGAIPIQNMVCPVKDVAKDVVVQERLQLAVRAGVALRFCTADIHRFMNRVISDCTRCSSCWTEEGAIP